LIIPNVKSWRARLFLPQSASSKFFGKVGIRHFIGAEVYIFIWSILINEHAALA
jgi:hypothetical protein